MNSLRFWAWLLLRLTLLLFSSADTPDQSAQSQSGDTVSDEAVQRNDVVDDAGTVTALPAPILPPIQNGQ